MLQSIKQFYGKALGASDGEIGHVKDFYFDDRSWAIRYVIVETGSWLSGRQVLISPHAFGKLRASEKLLRTNLSHDQIEHSPSIAMHKPVSRQFEEEYHLYYGWPYYWQGDALWGMSAFPIAAPQGDTVVPQVPTAGLGVAEAHLRSTQAVNGYHLQSGKEIIGHITDFMVDEESWRIGQLVGKIGHRFSGKEELIPISEVDRISYEQSTVFLRSVTEVIQPISAPSMVQSVQQS